VCDYTSRGVGGGERRVGSGMGMREGVGIARRGGGGWGLRAGGGRGGGGLVAGAQGRHGGSDRSGVVFVV
jgi:hypothetical protein